MARYALTISAAPALLAGCGSQQPIGAPGAMPQSHAIATHATLGGSWMLPGAESDDLLYVSDNIGNDVYIFSYPKGAPVGILTGFSNPLGECVDKAANVWIVNSSPSEIIEYAHGGTTPIATLSDPSEEPNGCSVDPTTGNLAVSNHYPGNVAIYQHAQGTPTLYSDPNLAVDFYCTFDNNGNLFVDGDNSALIAELPKGSGVFTEITLSKNINPGSIEWDGMYLAITDMAGGSHGPTPIDRVLVSGTTGTVVGTTLLKSRGNRKANTGVQYWIQGDTIVGPDHSIGGSTRLLEAWRYPAGGNAAKVLHPSRASALWGVTVSLAPNR